MSCMLPEYCVLSVDRMPLQRYTFFHQEHTQTQPGTLLRGK